jgi:SecD/SecF fusion protein
MPSPTASPTSTAAAAIVAPAVMATGSPTGSPTGTRPATTIAGPSSDTPSSELTTDPLAGGVSVAVTVTPEITYTKLFEELKKVTAADQIPFDVSSPLYADQSMIRLANWNVRLGTTPEKAATVLEALRTSLSEAPLFPSSENVGAAVAAGAKSSAIIAMIVSLAMVMAYVWFRFQNVAFGIASIAALLHDVLFTIGCLALSFWLAKPLGFALVEPFKIDLTIVAALLTIIGYSINDTIVIFDRIREVRGKSPTLSADLINKCLNQTLSRTILTALTVFIVVLILYIFGGQGIHGFAFALVVGTISGTYSTIYVASPILLWLYRKQNAAAQLGRTTAELAK